MTSLRRRPAMRIVCCHCGLPIQDDEEYIRRELGVVTVSGKSGRRFLQPVVEDILHTRCEVERAADPKNPNYDAFMDKFGKTCANCLEELDHLSEMIEEGPKQAPLQQGWLIPPR
jgi:hypothetical protein